MMKMEVSLQDIANPKAGELEAEIFGRSIAALKNKLENAILKLAATRRKFGYFDVFVMFTENGEYIDSDEMGIFYCNAELGYIALVND